MSAGKRKKVQKFRGSMTHGWGSKKKHRGKGSKGGKGFGGSTKHNRSYIYAKEPFHFGRRGFVSKTRVEYKVVNVGELEELSKDKELDLGKLGFGKLLGYGEITKSVSVKVGKFSKSAKEKIEKAGGSIIE